MATLTIRDLDDDVKARLRMRAARNGRSMEAEARAILKASLSPRRPDKDLGTYIHELFADIGGVEPDELVIPPRTDPARYVDFSE